MNAELLRSDLLLSLLLGIALGALAAWLLLRGRAQQAREQALAGAEIERVRLDEQAKAAQRQGADLQQRLQASEALAQALQQQLGDERQSGGRLAADVEARSRRMAEQERALAERAAAYAALADEHSKLRADLAGLKAELEGERQLSRDKLALLEQAREELSNQFKAVAGEILDRTSHKFTEQNQLNLGQLLNPLQERLRGFQSKVEEVYVNEGKDRSALAEQVKQLMVLNQTLSQDANNLTLALRGDNKAQGNWGELILENVLEKAGLIRGQHYAAQSSVKAEDGQSHVIPDVVVYLPGERHLVIDSKLSLPDYRAFAASESKADRDAALKRHLQSIRSHIKGLSEKNYQSMFGLKSIDFVIMFVPLEPAFSLAVTHDHELFAQAWERNVLLVSPSTLLFVIRTVAYLWRQEDLGRNAREISTRGAELYDKLCGFVADLDKVGERLEAAQQGYQQARRKFREGHGNVIRQAELLRKLGVKPSKSLPAAWTDPAMDEALPPPGDDA